MQFKDSDIVPEPRKAHTICTRVVARRMAISFLPLQMAKCLGRSQSPLLLAKCTVSGQEFLHRVCLQLGFLSCGSGFFFFSSALSFSTLSRRGFVWSRSVQHEPNSCPMLSWNIKSCMRMGRGVKISRPLFARTMLFNIQLVLAGSLCSTHPS